MSERADKDAMACNKPRRTPGHAKKSHVVKACYDGKQKLIRFGEQGASTAGKPKAGESERMKTKRASFKARHASNIAKGPSSPAYWANKVKWAEGGEVKMARGGNAAMALLEQMKRAGVQSQEFDPVLASTREQQRARPAQRPTQRPAPQATPQAAQPREAPLPLPPVPPSMRPDENPPPEAPRNPMRFDEGNPHVATAIRMAEKYGLPTNIFLSLVQQESGFDPLARSSRGAMGLGQLMPGTARELGVTDPFDPEQNLEASARYLRQMRDRFGDMPLALAAYNAGPGTVRRAGNTIPNNRETRNYVPSILRRAGANVPEGFAEGGLADLEQKYSEGGRVGRAVGAIRRAVTRRPPEPEAVAENPRAVIGGNRPPTMTPDEAMAIATARQPGAGVPRLEGEDLERANELSQRVLDFRASQMRLPLAQRIQPRPEDQLFPPARFDRPLEAGPESAALDLEALRIENIAPRQQLPGSHAGAGVASDLARNYGPTTDRIVEELGPIARLMRGEAVPDATAAQIASARSGEFYNMRPVYDVLRDAGVPHDEGIRRIRQEAQAIAGTSPRTDTEQNVLNSSFLQNRMARGLPVDAESVQAATGPGSGYGMIYDQHPALTRGLLEGEISLAQNPKPSIFARNISGDRSAVTADVHNVRAINMLYNDVNPGGLPASSFDTAGDYRLYRDAYTPDADGNIRGMTDAELREILVARPSGQGIRKQNVSTEYPIYNDLTTQVAERLNLTPADTQALMWFHYGPRTGLASDAHTVPELLNQRMSITAQGLGMSPDEVMRLYSRNMIPLAGAAPAALLLPENEPGRSLEDLDQKYAEGGAVSDEDAEYDRRLLSRMKSQTGRVTEPTRAEQMQALRTAGRSAAEGVADVLLPQSPLDFALMAALGPGGRAVRLAGSAALASLEPSEAEAGGLRRAARALLGSRMELPPAENSRLTQVATTGGTYEKARDVLRKRGIEGPIIDYGAGRGHGSRILGGDSFEPYPSSEFSPTYTNPGDIPSDRYARLVNLNVLNVLPPELRAEAVQNMGRVLRPEGTAIITTRGRDVMAARGTPGPEPMSLIIGEGDNARYQKGFTPRELREYLGEMLGDRFDVENLALGPAGAVVRRLYGAAPVAIGASGLADLDQKYAEGGEVSAMAYDPSAVDALVKEIEAEYV